MANIIELPDRQIDNRMTRHKIDDLDIQALVDNQNQFPLEERTWLLEAIKSDPVTRRRYEDLLRQKELLQAWWQENKRDSLQ